MLNGYMVYWIEEIDGTWFPQSEFCAPNEMTRALQVMDNLRKHGHVQFVTMASQNSNSVGKPGVDAVENGKTPDGQFYEWSKAGRAGKTKRSRLAPEVKVRTAESATLSEMLVDPTISTTLEWYEP